MAQVVDSKLASACVTYYQQIYLNDSAAAMTAVTQAYSSAVSFPVKDIDTFLAANPDADTLTIVPGVYTPEFAAKYGTKEGRLSLFLYAVASKLLGGTIPPDGDPLNMGTTEP